MFGKTRAQLHRESVDRQLAQIKSLLATILEREQKIMASIDDVIANVEAENTVIQSVLTLLTTLSDDLKAAQTDPAKLQSVIDSIVAQRQQLADAVVANTPAQ